MKSLTTWNRYLIFSLFFSLLNMTILQSSEGPKFVYGLKYSEEFSSDQTNKLSFQKQKIISTKALLPDQNSFKGGYNKLLPFVTPSPYQENAGSCLFMSHTGIIEILMGQLHRKKYDFSERYFMNLQKKKIGNESIRNWRTDTINRINTTKQIYHNKDYPFAKGYYKTKPGGGRTFSSPSEPNHYYGVKWNWIVDLERLSNNPTLTPVPLPYFERDILFEDPEENQWNIGTAPKNIVKLVKRAIKKRNAPVKVIYNHHGYWHANIIVGYNDNANSYGCPFVSNFQSKMDERASEIKEEALLLPEGKKRDKLLRKARNFNKKGSKVQQEYLANGGCRNKGVFYVRDSIYPSEKQALYDYDPKKKGEEQHLNEPVILREYEWLERLANNVIQIYIK